jgi:hypothetical protein
MTIWKDVPGFLNADPKFFNNTVKIDHIPFNEAIELAYYGASVIHPKTVKPIQNKGIHLNIKSFVDPDAEGSVIGPFDSIQPLTPLYIFKNNQVLISIQPKDFSFIAEDNLQRIFDAAQIKAPFVLCFDELEFVAPNPNADGEEGNITPQISAFFGMLNNCSKKGILVVATTNRPDLIDQAIMRVGCFDRVFFVPQPDFEARKDIFMDHLKDRPCEELDFDELARLSDDFNAGDITEAVNEAAMTAAYNDLPISQKILVDVLKYKNPTYSTKTRIGFNKK